VGLLYVCFLLGGFVVCVFCLVGGYGGCGVDVDVDVDVDVEVSFSFLFSFFVSCGMGDRFVVVVVWVVGFVVTVGSVVASSAENS